MNGELNFITKTSFSITKEEIMKGMEWEVTHPTGDINERRCEWESQAEWAKTCAVAGSLPSWVDVVRNYANNYGIDLDDCGYKPSIAWVVAGRHALDALEALRKASDLLFQDNCDYDGPEGDDEYNDQAWYEYMENRYMEGLGF